LGGWQRLWDSALEGGKLKQLAKLALQRDGHGGKGSLDEERVFIHDEGLFG